VLDLWFERRHRVLLVRVGGVFSSQDIETHDRLVVAFLAREGAVRGLYDFSDIDVVAVPESKIRRRGQAPAIISDARVVVAPHVASREVARLIRDEQLLAGHREPLIVSTLAEAYAVLGVDEPSFEPVKEA